MSVGAFDPAESQQQFLELLVAQIQNQDPLSPVSPEDTTAQLAQISTVSGINELNLQFREFLQAETIFAGANLVGARVEYTSPLTSEIETGVISEARSSNGQLRLTVNDQEIGIADVNAVIADLPQA